ncbi:MAG: RNA polymerase sigma factor [Flavobacteriales bacterium]|nr:RNA polymerase sigma factor [Bacteroidota bacterium]MCB9240600.1 RNA polymerase sigma factor [Flavobacteriales bacterium]
MYATKMLGVCSRYCPNMEDARDALHEGFIKVFRLIEKFKGNSALETWVTRIMINTSIDHFKKSIKYIHYESSEDVHALSNEDQAYYIESDDSQQVTSKQLLEVINKLPDGYRLVFNLYAVENYTHKEIAQELGISEGTSKSQLARARVHLKKLLKEELNLG